MDYFLPTVVAGVAGSATIVLLATALLVRLRTSKVVDLGLGAVAMYLAFAFFEFRASGDLVLPILGLPGRVHLIDRPTVTTSIIVVITFAAVIGAALHVLFYERLRDRPPLVSLAATLGILLYFQQMVQLRFSPGSAGIQNRSPVLPQGRLRLGTLTLSGDRLILLLAAIAVAAGMYILFSHTSFRRRADAATSNSLGAMCVGISPARVATFGASLSTTISAFALILAEPIVGLGPAVPLLVIPAVAAVLLGRLRSFVVTAAGALGIGAVQALILATGVGPGRSLLPSWLPVSGIQAVVPTLVIVIVLVRSGEILATRGSNTSVDHPISVRPRHVPWGIAAILLVTAFILVLGDPLLRQALALSAIATVLYLSVVVVTGYSGQLSLLPMTTAGIAGLVCLRLAHWGIPFLAAAAMALGCAATLGWIAGRSVRKLRGMSVALVTLALATSLDALVLNNELLSNPGATAWRPVKVLGLDIGFAGVGSPSYRPRFVVLTIAVLIVACAFTAALRSSSLGLRMLASKSNERRAAVLGVDVARSRTSAFVLASLLAGASGILAVFSLQRPSAMSFMVIGSIVAVALTTMAGAGGLSGAVLAGVIAPGGLFMALVSGSEGGTGATYVSALSGISLALTVGLLPDGVMRAVLESRSRRRQAHADSTLPIILPTGIVALSEGGTHSHSDVPVLTIRGLEVDRGGTRVFDDVSLSVHRGEVVGLMGHNGAGKTTLFDACSGLVGISKGDIRIGEHSIVDLPVHHRADVGLARTFQSDALFGQLTVKENLQVARQTNGRASAVRSDHLDVTQALALSLAMAVASKPRVLLLDEPADGLDPESKQRLASWVREMAESGMAVVVCDHDPAFVEQVADRLFTLGEVGPSADPTDAGRPLVDPGRLAVLCGEESAVQSTLERVVGLDSGFFHRPSLPGLARRGLAYVPASGGLFSSMSVEDNLVMGNGNRRLTYDQLEWLDSAFPELAAVVDRAAGVLSGGEQQLLAVARALVGGPRTLVVDRPFQGLSLTATRRTIYELQRAATNGASIVLARIDENQSVELPESVVYMPVDKMDAEFLVEV